MRNSSNLKQQATINDGRLTLQPIQGRQTYFTAGTTRTYTPGASGSNSRKRRTFICYNCKGEGHMSKQCTKPKRKRDDSWFKDKVLLVQAQVNGQILHEEELAFLADPGMQKKLNTNPKVALMANLSHYGSDALAKSQEKDTVIRKLKERIKSLNGNMNKDKVKKDIEEIETINIELDHRVSKLIAGNEHLKQTYKQLYDSIKPTQTFKRKFGKPTGKVFTNFGYTWRPTGRTFTIVGNACPLNMITTTTEVPLRKPTALESDTPKPVVTLVYSRKPKKSKTNVPVSKPKNIKSLLFLFFLSKLSMYLDSGCSKHMTGDLSQLTNFVNKFLGTVKFRNDHVAKILGYGDYQIRNVTILRVYYVEGLRHNLFSVGDMMASFPICLLSKASKTKSWLWHRHLSHLNFGAVATAYYTQNRSIIRLCHGKTPYELLHDKLPNLSFFHVFGALCYPINDSENLGKLQPKADIGLVPKPSPSTPFVPPSRTDWDLLFQPLFDELLNPPSSIDCPAPKVIASIAEVVALEPAALTGSPSSTTIDQDAPSPSNSQTAPETQSPVIPNDVEEDNHDLDVAHMNNNLFFGILIPKNDFEASSSLDVIPTVVHTDTPNLEHITKWTKDHPLENIIVKPKNYKDSLTQACWIEAMQEELHEFKCLEVRELIPRPDKVMVITLKWIYKVKLDEMGGILKNKDRLVARGYRQEEGIDFEESFALISQSPRGIFLNQCKYALESLKKYGIESSDPVDTPIVEKSKLDEDTQGKVVDPTHYHGMIGTLMYLTASRPDLIFVLCMCVWYRAKPTKKHLYAVKRIFKYLRRTLNQGLWYPKDSSIARILDEVLLDVCNYWETDLLVGHQKGRKVLRYPVQKLNILPCLAVHIDIKFHFIKEQVENGVIELYFVNKEYELADIFTKALCRERIEFLINKLALVSCDGLGGYDWSDQANEGPNYALVAFSSSNSDSELDDWRFQIEDDLMKLEISSRVVSTMFLVSTSFTQGKVSSIPIGSSISLEGYLSFMLLLVVIIVMVVIVAVILIVVVIVIVGVVIIVVFTGIVVVVGVSSIFKPSFVIIGFLHRITLYYLIH
ncbi:retrovirus-related pol polyprotein from transposon TNT 1-94 [Tanacetum coccineum]